MATTNRETFPQPPFLCELFGDDRQKRGVPDHIFEEVSVPPEIPAHPVAFGVLIDHSIPHPFSDEPIIDGSAEEMKTSSEMDQQGSDQTSLNPSKIDPFLWDNPPDLNSNTGEDEKCKYVNDINQCQKRLSDLNEFALHTFADILDLCCECEAYEADMQTDIVLRMTKDMDDNSFDTVQEREHRRQTLLEDSNVAKLIRRKSAILNGCITEMHQILNAIRITQAAQSIITSLRNQITRNHALKDQMNVCIQKLERKIGNHSDQSSSLISDERKKDVVMSDETLITETSNEEKKEPDQSEEELKRKHIRELLESHFKIPSL